MDPEAEMKLSAPLPLYLQTLVDKYCNDTNPKKMHSGAALDTVSRFSAFLASCVLNNVWCSTAETKCLRILVDASEDGSVREMSAAPPKLEAYWRHRIFNFLKTLRELKAVPKKDQLLADKWDWMSGGEKIACATSQAAKVEEK